ncbi:putative NADH-flavin reductase [Thiogranum longum]|uniref:Putative NADH-flavin reductase n=1 Tax=Thiogranum longum TaxID=1537524 RepID=A0A4R1HMS6_9GAMM|nr:NAD(P)-binding oxidoreductase [Thiogranum longum]TCK18552.1 putative NADH-flavin reductase [Thiogranum longum]
MKKMLILGASGATGRLLVEILLKKGVEIIAIVRNASSLTNIVGPHPGLQIVEADISEIPESDLAQYVRDCEAVLCCLGHNLTFKGMFGHPRRLVTNAVKKITKTAETVHANNKMKIVLMNTTGNSNRDIPEKPPFSQRFVISILRFLLPPHVDNENAADFLRLEIGQNNNSIEWAAVRPDALVNEDQISQYDIYTSPIRNAIFDAGSISRINVADFMSELAINSELWDEWKGKMPVIYSHA